MSEVDERIVKMTFDNKQFEEASKTTMGTLDKLKASLNFDRVKDVFGKISSSAAKVDLSPIQNGAEAVADRFKIVDTAVQQVVRTLTTQATLAAEKFVSAFTIDPIKSGLQEYETQIGAIQTIMSNTEEAFEGISRDDHLQAVNDTLAELNTYADKTIYNFTEMTKNIGTFTAAGVDLETSAGAIQGIANMAAMSGSTSQQASTAMYQLSQALAAGSVKLQDWNSVVNAGMGGKLFQNKLIEVSEELGTGAKYYMDAAGSFRESLKYEWITSDVLAETLNRATMKGAIERSVRGMQEYANASEDVIKARVRQEEEALNLAIANGQEEKGYKDMIARLSEYNALGAQTVEKDITFARNAQDAATKVRTFTALVDTLKEAMQSGWTQTWSILIGDFDQATELFTAISNKLGAIIQVFSDSRNGAIQAWADANGRKHLLGALRGLYYSVVRIARPISKAWNMVFPPEIDENGFRVYYQIGYILKEATKAVRLFTRTLKSSKEHQDNIQKTFEVIFTIIKAITTVLGKFIKVGILVFIKAVQFASEVIFFLTSRLWRFKDAISGIASFISAPLDLLMGLLLSIGDTTTAVGMGFRLIASAVGGFVGVIGSAISGFKESIKTFFSTNEAVLAVQGAFRNLVIAIINFFKNVTGIRMQRTLANFGTLSDKGQAAAENILRLIKPLAHFAGGAIAKGIETVSGALATLFNAASNAVSGKTDALFEFIRNLRLAKTESDKLGSLTNLHAAIGSIGEESKKTLKITDTLKSAVTKIKDFLSNAFKIIAKQGEGIATLLKNTFVNSFVNIKDAFKKGDLQSISDILVNGLMGASLVKLFIMFRNFKKNTKGVASAFTDMLSGVTDTLKAVQSQIKAEILSDIAKSIAILVASIVVLSLIDQEALDKAIRAIITLAAVILTFMKVKDSIQNLGKDEDTPALGFFSNISSSISDLIKSYKASNWGKIARALATLAVGIFIISKAVMSLAQLSGPQLARGLGGVGAIMVALGLMAWWLKKNGDVVNVGFGIGFIGVANGVSKIAKAIAMLAGIEDTKKLRAGTIAIIAVIASMGLALKIIGDPKHMLSIGTGMVAMSIAIIAIVGAIALMAKIIEKARADTTGESMENLVMGAAVIAGIMAMFALTFAVMNPKTMKGTAAAIFAMSISLYLVIGALVTMMKVLSGIKDDKQMDTMVSAMKAIAQMMLAMAIAVRIMGGGVQGLGAAAAIIAIAIALRILAPAIQMLSQCKLGDVVKGLILIAGAFVLLAVAAIALQNWMQTIKGLTTAFLKISIGVLALSVALLLLSPAIVKLSAVLAIAGVAIVGALFAILGAIIAGIGAMIGEIIGLVVLLGKGVCAAIIALAPDVCDAIAALLAAAVYAIAVSAYSIAEALVMIILAIIDVLATYMNPIVDRVVTLIINFFLALGDNIRHHTEGVVRAITTVCEALLEIFISVIEGLLGEIPWIGDKVVAWAKETKEEMRKELDDMGVTENGVANMEKTFTSYTDIANRNAEDMKLAGAANGTAFFDGLKSATQNGNPLTDTINGLMDPNALKLDLDMSQFSELGGNIDAGIGGGVFDNKDLVTKPMGDMMSEGFDIMETVSNTHSPSVRGEDLGMNIDLGVAKGLEEGSPDVKRAFRGVVVDLFELTKVDRKKISKMTGEMADTFGKAMDSNKAPESSINNMSAKMLVELMKLQIQFSAAGNKVILRFTAGMSSKFSVVYAALRGLKTAMLQIMNGLNSDFETVGNHSINGLSISLKNGQKEVYKAGTELAKSLRSGYTDSMEIMSPSRAMGRLADFSVDGLVNKVNQRAEDAHAAGSSLGESLQGGLLTALMLMAAAVDGIAECDPVIRPVLDLSGIQNGANMIEGMMAQRSYMLSMQLGDYNNGQINRLNSISASLDAQSFDNSDVVRSVNNVGARLDALEEAIRSMTIVLDDGTIAGRIDRTLGRTARYKARGN